MRSDMAGEENDCPCQGRMSQVQGRRPMLERRCLEMVGVVRKEGEG